jgi:hypothetical protein
MYNSDKLPFAHHRGQVGGGIPDSKTAPEGAAVHIAVTKQAYSGFSRQQKTRTRRA